jgi:hypothetical protein
VPRISFQSSSAEYVYIPHVYCAQRLVLENRLYNNCFEEHITYTEITTHVQNKTSHFHTSIFLSGYTTCHINLLSVLNPRLAGKGLLNLGRVSVLHAENP